MLTSCLMALKLTIAKVSWFCPKWHLLTPKYLIQTGFISTKFWLRCTLSLILGDHLNFVLGSYEFLAMLEGKIGKDPFFKGSICSNQSSSISKETIDVIFTAGMLWSNKVHIITLALLHKFVYEFRGNNTYNIIEDWTVLSLIFFI